MDNRDWFQRGSQGGGRDSYDYGRSGFIEPEHDESKWFPFGFWAWVFVTTPVAGAVIRVVSSVWLTVAH